MLVTCFTFDLYLTIVNPLYPAEKRFRGYLTLSFFACVSLYIFEYWKIKGKFGDFFVHPLNESVVEIFTDYH